MPSFHNRVELDVKMAPKLPKTAAKNLKRAVRRARKVKLREEEREKIARAKVVMLDRPSKDPVKTHSYINLKRDLLLSSDQTTTARCPPYATVL